MMNLYIRGKFFLTDWYALAQWNERPVCMNSHLFDNMGPTEYKRVPLPNDMREKKTKQKQKKFPAIGHVRAMHGIGRRPISTRQ